MFLQKINYIWAINLMLFIAVVFLGIDQAGKGAVISNLERRLDEVSVTKRELSENIFNSESDDKKITTAIGMGYSKPSTILYFNSIEVVASIK
jgi:hypothetical protein